MSRIPPRAIGSQAAREYPNRFTEVFTGRALQFTYTEAASGVVLLITIVIALIWANSPWAASYTALWQTPFTVALGPFGLSKPLLLWINDGLMALFFFVVGLEIKRELLYGELNSLRRASFPAIGALGGMIVPALIYLALNAGTAGSRGWGIPMATDIAIALGMLALLGNRVSPELRVWLLGLAIIDDIGAILVIAVFYSHGLSIPALIAAIAIFAAIWGAIRAGITSTAFFIALGVAFWMAVLQSGIHATIAGVLLAVLVPASARLGKDRLFEILDSALDRLEEAAGADERQSALGEIEVMVAQTEPPLDRIERLLHRWVSFVVVPIFALANAGVALTAESLSTAVSSPVALGVAFGLIVGKPVGILLASFFGVQFRLAELPPSVGWKDIAGGGLLAGIGFTVALFIAELAFNDAALLANAKVGILIASAVAAVAGLIVLRLVSRTRFTEAEHGVQHG